jgi:photosystem II stability/assembly factor-like uncharacterized protein
MLYRILTPIRKEGGLAVTRLYVAGGSAVSIIEDGRFETGLDGRGARCLAPDPQDPDTLYVGTTDEGIFKSEDGGRSWEDLSGIAHNRVTAVAVSPADGALYAGTEPSALFVSRDGGDSWHLELPTPPLDLPRPCYRALLYGPEPRRGRHRTGWDTEEH